MCRDLSEMPGRPSRQPDMRLEFSGESGSEGRNVRVVRVYIGG